MSQTCLAIARAVTRAPKQWRRGRADLAGTKGSDVLLSSKDYFGSGDALCGRIAQERGAQPDGVKQWARLCAWVNPPVTQTRCGGARTWSGSVHRLVTKNKITHMRLPCASNARRTGGMPA